MHRKQKACRDAHPTALQAFKERLSAAATTSGVVHPPEIPLVNQIAVIWDECKSKKALQAGMNKMEDRLRQEYEDDSDNEQDYVFSANDAMRYVGKINERQ